MLFEIFLTLAIGLVYILSQLIRRPQHYWKRDGMGIHGPCSRRLGVTEQIMAQIGETGALNLSNVMFIRSKMPLTVTTVHRALEAMSKRHPLLRMRLGKENNQFAYMKEIEDFKVDFEVADTEDWQGLVEEQILITFDAEKGPLWRVKFLPETSYNDGQQDGYPYQAACVFAFHHIITDGPSYNRLFGEFLTRLHEILDGNEPIVEPMSLLPPVDAYIDSAQIYSLTYNIRINLFSYLTSIPPVMRRMLQGIMKSPVFVKKLGVETDRNPNASAKTCMIPVELTKEQTSQLLAACKRHKTTVHCVIQTAACVAYCTMADGGRLTQKHKIASTPSCNLRPYLQSEELTDYCGAYFSGVMLFTEVGPELEFWHIVSKVTTDLKDLFTSNSQFMFFITMANLLRSDMLSLMSSCCENLPGRRHRDIVFTNHGNLKYLYRDETYNVKLTARFGCVAEHDEGAVFAHNLATFNDKLFWTFVYYSHVTNKEQAQRYADVTIETLFREIND